MAEVLLTQIRNAKPEVWKKTLPVWIVLNCIGFAFFVGMTYLGYVGSAFAALVAAILGFLQWAALSEMIGVNWYWPLASIPAYTALLSIYLDNDPMILASMPSATPGDRVPHLGLMVLRITIWLAVWGLLQWLALRPFLHRALIWPIASAAAGLVGTLLAIVVIFIVSPAGEPSPLLFWPFFALIYIPATGITLIVLRLLPKPTKQDIWY